MQNEEMTFHEYIKVLQKGKWSIFSIVIFFLLVVIVMIFFRSPVYQASTTILISPFGTQHSILNGTGNNLIYGGIDEIETQIEIIKSYSIIREVAEKLPEGIFEKAQAENIAKKEENANWLIQSIDRIIIILKKIFNVFFSNDPKLTQPVPTEVALKNNIKKISNTLKVNTLKNTHMIKIIIENNNPELAAIIANTIATVFVDNTIKTNRSKAAEVKKFINTQLEKKAKELIEEEERLLSEKESEAIQGNELKIARLERDLRVSENMYILLLTKYEEARINEVMEFGNIRVINKALPPDEPIKPRKLFNLTIGGILGLMIGIFFVFIRNHMDNTIKTKEDIEKYLKIPILGTIPRDIVEKKEKIYPREDL